MVLCLSISQSYAGTAQGLHFEEGRNTFWAPDLFRLPDKSSLGGLGAEYHLHVTCVPLHFDCHF